MSSRKRKKQGVTISRRTLVILTAAVVLLVAGGVMLGMNWNRWFGDTAAEDEFTPDIDPDARNWDGGSLADEDEGKAEGIRIPGYPSITIPADTADVTVALLNPEGNPCYFIFELVLSDTDEVLYTSKMVPPGQMVSDITLSRALPAGEYNAAIRISTASLEDGSAMNGANVETVLIAQ